MTEAGKMNAQDPFFTTDTCHRCGKTPLPARTMSWFTEETICIECSSREKDIRKKICEKEGKLADLKYEGCGYIPKT